MDRNFRMTTAGLLRSLAVGGTVIAGLAPAVPAIAASSGSIQDQAADQARLIDDFLHYLLIAKPDLAEAAGNKLFATGITDAEIADIVREKDLGDKVERAISRGRGMASVGPMVTRFEDALEDGRLNLARDQDRISEAIGIQSSNRCVVSDVKCREKRPAND